MFRFHLSCHIVFFGVAISCMCASCHRESELERVVRQANEKCPVTITDGMRLDSILLYKSDGKDETDERLAYYVTLFGIYDEPWMKDVVEANLSGLDDRQVAALLAQGLNDEPKFEKLLSDNNCDLYLVLQYSDGKVAKSYFISDVSACLLYGADTVSATMNIIRRDAYNSNAACPVSIADGIVMQSVSLDEDSNILTYRFQIGDSTLSPDNVDRSLLESLQATIASDLDQNPSMRIYRDNKVTIRYWFENKKGIKLYGFDF